MKPAAILKPAARLACPPAACLALPASERHGLCDKPHGGLVQSTKNMRARFLAKIRILRAAGGIVREGIQLSYHKPRTEAVSTRLRQSIPTTLTTSLNVALYSAS